MKKSTLRCAALTALTALLCLAACTGKGADVPAPDGWAGGITDSAGGGEAPAPAALEPEIPAPQALAEAAGEPPAAGEPEPPAEKPEPADDLSGNGSIRDLDLSAARLAPLRYVEEEQHVLSGLVREAAELYFVGFSRDGKIAYIESESREGRGDTILRFYIQNLVTDKVLETVESDNEHDDRFYYAGNLTEYFIEKNYRRIDAAIESHRIHILDCAYGRLPYVSGADRIDAAIHITAEKQQEDYWFTLFDYSCVATDGGGRSKTVESCTDRNILGAYVCGYLKSPFENRLALVIAESQFGFEGYDMLYHVVGCDVEKGFGK